MTRKNAKHHSKEQGQSDEDVKPQEAGEIRQLGITVSIPAEYSMVLTFKNAGNSETDFSE